MSEREFMVSRFSFVGWVKVVLDESDTQGRDEAEIHEMVKQHAKTTQMLMHYDLDDRDLYEVQEQ